MHKFKTTYAVFTLVIFTAVFTSCNEDFNTLESSIDIGDNFNTSLQKYNVKAYTKKFDPIQTNGLPVNLIGVYKDGYGSTTSSVVSQMTPAVFDPSFPCGTTFDSIVLNIPYFSTNEDTDDEGDSTFRLDSVFGNQPMELSIYRNNYFLRNFQVDGDFNDRLGYFSNNTTSENNPVNNSDLEGDMLYQDLSFVPDSRQIRFLDEEDEIVARANPAIRIRLNNEPDDEDDVLDPDISIPKDLTFWEDLILALEDQPELSNPNNFTNYFRGLYIKAKALNNDGSFMILNLTNGATIEMYYSVKDEDDDDIPDYADNGLDEDGDGINNDTDADYDGNDDDDDPDNGPDEDGDGISDAALDEDGDGVHNGADADSTNGNDNDNDANGLLDTVEEANSGSFILNFSGTRVNFTENNFMPSITDGDAVEGDETLFLKGGEGSMAVIELFDENIDGNSVEDFIEDFRGDDIENPKRLINEAFLNFYVDQDMVQGQEEPDRIYIFDLKNEIPLIDYFVDQSFANTPLESKPIHLPALERVGGEANGKGIRYRARITEHLNNILLRDSINAKLGLVVSKNVSLEDDTTLNFDVKNDDEIFDYIPISAILSPRGTVLHGSTLNVPDDKRIELEVYYTEPEF